MRPDLVTRLYQRHMPRRGDLDQSPWICTGHAWGSPPEWPCEIMQLLDYISDLEALLVGECND